MIFSKEFADEVYNILVQYGEATEGDRASFVDSHSNHRQYGECTEWRFCGNLGFGGKYRSNTNTVDCYKEDLNEKKENTIKVINENLQLVAIKYLINKCKYLSIIPYSQKHKHSFSNYYCSMSDFGHCPYIESMLTNVYFDCRYKE
jgi:hypothetical protein